jgi:hypothetical protein
MGVSSCLVKDCFNFQKNSKHVKGKKKFRRPEKCMGVILARKVLSKQHRYGELEVDSGISSRAIRLPAAAFQQPVNAGSMSMGQVVSTASKPSWYSPSAANYNQQQADLEVLRVAASTNSWDKLSTCWLGCFCQRKHKVLIKLHGTSLWFFAAHHWPDSSVLAWPAVSGLMPGPGAAGSDQYFQPDLSVKKPVLLTMDSLEEWDAISYQWKSPAWQCARYPDAMDSMEPAVRAFPKPGQGPCYVMPCSCF